MEVVNEHSHIWIYYCQFRRRLCCGRVRGICIVERKDDFQVVTAQGGEDACEAKKSGLKQSSRKQDAKKISKKEIANLSVQEVD